MATVVSTAAIGYGDDYELSTRGTASASTGTTSAMAWSAESAGTSELTSVGVLATLAECVETVGEREHEVTGKRVVA